MKALSHIAILVLHLCKIERNFARTLDGNLANNTQEIIWLVNKSIIIITSINRAWEKSILSWWFFTFKTILFSRLPANALDSWPTWCCPPRVWCMPPHCPPRRCWPWCSRWPSSPCWAPQASRPGPETVHGTDVCPGSCASRSTQYRSERRGSDWPSPDLRVRDNYSFPHQNYI